MAASADLCRPERDFHHPFTPYEIQKQFMNSMYDCLEAGKVGIFESPTGTGKSLSLICASLTWLRDHKSRELENGDSDRNSSEEPEWILQHDRKMKRQRTVQKRNDLEARLARTREKEEKARIRFEKGEPPTKRVRMSKPDSSGDEEDRFLLDDYDSGNEQMQIDGNKFPHTVLTSSKTKVLMEKLGMFLHTTKQDEDPDIEDGTKIYYCSRTHSQLTQFARELQRVKLPVVSYNDPFDTAPAPKIDTEVQVEEVKYLTLGSRKNLCINAKVSALPSATMINERCLELQQPSVPKDQKCSHLPSKDSEVLVNDFRDHTLAKIRDIEDLGRLGTKIGICPYYASREAIKPSEIVTLPYPLLLQKSAREALNISLKGNVVIIDEAHNLMDAISNIHSASVTLAQLYESRRQLEIYLQKFRHRLKGANRVYVTQLIRLLDSLAIYLKCKANSKACAEAEIKIGDLLTGKGVDQINLFKLMQYLQESKLARKVDGYAIYREKKEERPPQENSKNIIRSNAVSSPCLMVVQRFLAALTHPEAEGRFFYAKSSSNSADSESQTALKYLLLDSTHHFKEIVEDARAVMLVGGTMSPMSDYTDYLLHYLPIDRIATSSYGHVIPTSNLLACTVRNGPNGTKFDFTFEKRTSEGMINDLGQGLIKLAEIVPDGLLVFLPSHAYLLAVKKVFEKSDGKKSLNALLSEKKRIFYETSTGHDSGEISDKRSTIDAMLTAYSKHIATGKGGILFAVIGGSLSEGINFSDGLGRGIVVVGMPFPNPHSPEWNAKLDYIEKKNIDHEEPKMASKEFFENACLRAVNQTIGRAIRHREDYAAILLFDSRYQRNNIVAKLPNWIRASMREDLVTFRDISHSIERFFRSKAA